MWEASSDDLFADVKAAEKGGARIVGGELTGEDIEVERSLRPLKLDDYCGQDRVCENLRVLISAAKSRNESLDHVIFSGPPGLGKTTLAGIVANEMGARLRTTSGPAIERTGDLAAILTNLEEGDVLFVDEIHRLNHQVEEVLYPAMEDFFLDIVIGKGPAARSIRLDVPRFTLVGATTRTGLLTGPLRDRFGISYRLDYYSVADLAKIVSRSAKILGVELDAEASAEIASRSRGTPRLANRLLKRVRDYAQVKAQGEITWKVAAEALTFFENVPSIRRKIETLNDVGLSYIKLGQPSTELSGGEAQRIKLATELSRRATGRTIYILDEPTTGLHFADVQKLIDILHRLADGGNTVVVIEHNLDVIKTADYIIDMGPEGGEGGGTVIARGTPEQLVKMKQSYTGQFLAPYLKKK